MAISLSYSMGFVVLIFASTLVVAQNKNDTDPCLFVKECTHCAGAKFPTNKSPCVFEITPEGAVCTSDPSVSEGISYKATNISECKEIPSTVAPPETTTITSTTAAPTNATTPTTAATTTVPPNSTTTLQPTPPTTNGTSTTTPATTPTTPVPTTPTTPTNSTTPTPVPGPTTTASPAPANATTTAAPPVPSGGMSFASFIGGIVFTLALSAVGYMIFRFYSARRERYHTL